jgi:Ca2+-binding EF-hand superfamily protein
MRRRVHSITNLLLVFLVAIGVAVGTSFAQKTSVPKQRNTIAMASDNAREIFLLMNTNRNGKISKQAWMRFMEAEFDRLDTTKKGEIDPKELVQSADSAGHIRTSDLGK